MDKPQLQAVDSQLPYGCDSTIVFPLNLINGNLGVLVCVLDCPERRIDERSPGSFSLHGSVGSRPLSG